MSTTRNLKEILTAIETVDLKNEPFKTIQSCQKEISDLKLTEEKDITRTQTTIKELVSRLFNSEKHTPRLVKNATVFNSLVAHLKDNKTDTDISQWLEKNKKDFFAKDKTISPDHQNILFTLAKLYLELQTTLEAKKANEAKSTPTKSQSRPSSLSITPISKTTILDALTTAKTLEDLETIENQIPQLNEISDVEALKLAFQNAALQYLQIGKVKKSGEGSIKEISGPINLPPFIAPTTPSKDDSKASADDSSTSPTANGSTPSNTPSRSPSFSEKANGGISNDPSPLPPSRFERIKSSVGLGSTDNPQQSWDLIIKRINDKKLTADNNVFPKKVKDKQDREFIVKLAQLHLLCDEKIKLQQTNLRNLQDNEATATTSIKAAFLREVFEDKEINLVRFEQIKALHNTENLISNFNTAASEAFAEKFKEYETGDSPYRLEAFKDLGERISPVLYETTVENAAKKVTAECKAFFNSLANPDEKQSEIPTMANVQMRCKRLNRLDIFVNVHGVYAKNQLNDFINEMLDDESCLAPKNRNNRFFGDCIGRPTTHKSKVDTLSETLKKTRDTNVPSLQEATIKIGDIAKAIADYRQELFNACSFQNLRDLNAFLKKTFPTEYQSFDMPHDATKVARKDIGPTLSTLHTALMNTIKNYITSTEPRAPKPNAPKASM